MSVWDAGRSYRDLGAGLYTGRVEDVTEAGVFTILLVGEGERHRHIKYALEGVHGVQVVLVTPETAKMLGTAPDLFVMDEVPTVADHTNYAGVARRGKGERKRNKAERYR